MTKNKEDIMQLQVKTADWWQVINSGELNVTVIDCI